MFDFNEAEGCPACYQGRIVEETANSSLPRNHNCLRSAGIFRNPCRVGAELRGAQSVRPSCHARSVANSCLEAISPRASSWEYGPKSVPSRWIFNSFISPPCAPFFCQCGQRIEDIWWAQQRQGLKIARKTGFAFFIAPCPADDPNCIPSEERNIGWITGMHRSTEPDKQ